MARFNKLFTKKLYIPDGKKKGQNNKMSLVTATASELNALDGITASVSELNALDGITATVDELNLNDGQTATAAEVNLLDTSANGALMTVGAGISDAATAIVKYGISRAGDIITTQILIDITGLQSGGANNDIFGDPTGAGAKSHFGQITTAVNGLNWGGHVRCLETPAGCNTDIDFAVASVDSGAQDGDVTALTNYAQILNGGAQAAGNGPQELTAVIPANYYLYMAAGTTTDTVASAGRFLITLFGYVA